MKQILTLIDPADATLTSKVVQAAQRMAGLMHGKLYLLNVETPDSEFEGRQFHTEDLSRNGIAHELRRRHRALHVLEVELRRLGIDATAIMVRGQSVRGSPVKKILQEVNRLMPDLIVMGSHQHGILHYLLNGSVSYSVLHHAIHPVLIVPSTPQKSRRRSKAAPKTSTRRRIRTPRDRAILSIR